MGGEDEEMGGEDEEMGGDGRRWVKLRSIPIFTESLVERNDRVC